ncbi:hypothetical protein [Microvirga sp. Mcv34]|uniref:hypothetical protein n=1 Tax=Microvirga sp. Mcv34 TaxID=2926016 RepID=UPI0021C760C3|nr:hypothetical protein [Microvirga sp. Mcv34]
MLLSLIYSHLQRMKGRRALPPLDDVLLHREKELIAQWTPELDAEARKEGWTMVQTHRSPLLALHILDPSFVGYPEQYVRMRARAGSRAAWVGHTIHWQLSVARKLASEGRLRKVEEPDQALHEQVQWLLARQSYLTMHMHGVQLVACDELRRRMVACSDHGAIVAVAMKSLSPKAGGSPGPITLSTSRNRPGLFTGLSKR